MRILHSLILSLSFCFGACASAWSADGGGASGNFLPPQPGASKSGVVSSVEAMTSTPYSTANQFSLAADYEIRNEHYDEAIKLCKRALAADNTDLDIHKTYAQALESKINKEKSDDPQLFNACLREWLIVMRMERGPDKVANFHGITVPGTFSLYGDEDYTLEARQHLIGLTGKTPRVWESDTEYVKRAGQATSSTVTGRILPAGSGKTEEPAVAKPHVLPVEKKSDPLDWLNGN